MALSLRMLQLTGFSPDLLPALRRQAGSDGAALKVVALPMNDRPLTDS